VVVFKVVIIFRRTRLGGHWPGQSRHLRRLIRDLLNLSSSHIGSVIHAMSDEQDM
ncbi:hypothetical protein ACH5RR_008953, partial [Cinchona calisaya]